MTSTPELVSKSEFRNFAKILITQFNPNDKLKWESCILNHLRALLEEKKPKRVISYRSDRFEVDIFPLVEEFPNIEFYYPKVDKISLSPKLKFLSGKYGWEKGSFGLWEPKQTIDSIILQPSLCEMVFLPGLAFHERGYRLGRGAGFYDLNLRDVPRESIFAVIWESCNSLPFPYEAHDIRAGYSISEIGVRGFLD